MVSCDGNLHNVKLKGEILDDATGEPIQGAEVTTTWWVYDMSNTAWESKPVMDSTVSGTGGDFELTIKKAEAYGLLVIHPDYFTYQESSKLNFGDFNTTILLTRK